MILLPLLLSLAQDVPAQPADEAVDEIVVTAVYGRTTMLFDKGADGRLYNCRILVSSGSQRRDTNACQATPVCYAATADQVTDCNELQVAAGRLPGLGEAAETAKDPAIITAPKLVQPVTPQLPAGSAGPLLTAGDDKEDDRHRARRLPPPPTEEKTGSGVRVTLGDPSANP